MDQTEGAVTPAMRHKARHFALQAIYQWQMNKMPAHVLEQQFLEDQPVQNTDLEYMHDLIQGVIANCDYLDSIFEPFLSRPLDDLDQVDKAILRLGTFELKYRQEVPFKVVLNEAILLAKSFAEQDSHKFVNAAFNDFASDSFRFLLKIFFAHFNSCFFINN